MSSSRPAFPRLERELTIIAAGALVSAAAIGAAIGWAAGELMHRRRTR